MLDGETVVQADRDIYIIKEHGKNNIFIEFLVVVNIVLVLTLSLGLIFVHKHATEEIREIVIQEVPGQVRLILMP